MLPQLHAPDLPHAPQAFAVDDDPYAPDAHGSSDPYGAGSKLTPGVHQPGSHIEAHAIHAPDTVTTTLHPTNTGGGGGGGGGEHNEHKGSDAALERPRVPVLTILAMTCFMSGMAGFGAVPFFFMGRLQPAWAGLANAVACGVMLAASFDLLHEGAPYSPMLTILGMVLGAFFIK